MSIGVSLVSIEAVARAGAMYDVHAETSLTIAEVTGDISVAWQVFTEDFQKLANPDGITSAWATGEHNSDDILNLYGDTEALVGDTLHLNSFATGSTASDGFAYSLYDLQGWIKIENHDGASDSEVQFEIASLLQIMLDAETPSQDFAEGAAYAKIYEEDEHGEISQVFFDESLTIYSDGEGEVDGMNPMTDTFPIRLRPAETKWIFIDNDVAGIAESIPPHDPIPEPTTVALLGIGLVGLAGAEVRRRRKKKSINS